MVTDGRAVGRREGRPRELPKRRRAVPVAVGVDHGAHGGCGSCVERRRAASAGSQPGRSLPLAGSRDLGRSAPSPVAGMPARSPALGIPAR
jgi:hypothetical protein